MNNKKDNIIGVTGGSGHLGTCLIKQLLEDNYKVKALYNTFLPDFSNENLVWIKGNILNANLNSFFEEIETVIHCASIISIGNSNHKNVLEVNINGTENIINHCSKFNTKLIYISSSEAIIKDDDQVLNEQCEYKTNDDFLYGYSKAKAEQLVLKATNETNLKTTILRPSAIVGPPDYRPSMFGKTIVDLANGKLPALTKSGYNIIDVRDLSQTIINCLEIKNTEKVYLVGGSYISLKEISRIVNPSKKILELPISFLLILLPFINLYKYFFGLNWPINKDSLTILKNAPKHIDSSRAVNQLNHTTRPVKETILDTVNWFKSQ